MADYSCQLSKCVELNNHVCQRQGFHDDRNKDRGESSPSSMASSTAPHSNSHHHPQSSSRLERREFVKCRNIADICSEWSDVAAFYYIGFYVHAGIPFRIEKIMDTGGWIGPYNLVLAQDFADHVQLTKTRPNMAESASKSMLQLESKRPDETPSSHDELEKDNNFNTYNRKDETATTTTTTVVVDRYRVRYVETPSTPALTRHTPVNNTLFLDWDSVMGYTAVNTTRHLQANLHHGDNAYASYQESCAHGNLQPILPLYSFEFRLHQQPEPQPDSDDDEEDKDHNNRTNITAEEEEIVLQIDYQMLLIPKTHDKAYKWMPWIQKHIRNEKDQLGFTIDGPFCYGDDPKRAYTISISIDSAEASKLHSGLKIVHGCVEGLPCLPPAALGPTNLSSSSALIKPSYPAVVDVSKMLYEVGFWCLLLLWILTLCWYRMYPILRKGDDNEEQDEERQAAGAHPETAVEEGQQEQVYLLTSHTHEPYSAEFVPTEQTPLPHDLMSVEDEFVDCIDEAGAPSDSVPLILSIPPPENEPATTERQDPPSEDSNQHIM